MGNQSRIIRNLRQVQVPDQNRKESKLTCLACAPTASVPASGYYELPIRFISIRESVTHWLYLKASNKIYCYEKIGEDYYNSHYRTRGKCTDDRGRNPMPNKILLSMSDVLEVFFTGPCLPEEINIQLVKE